ncbi:PilN domain-containing protein [Patescibacteria group bacterium]|nr:PilN domain-containing protein [Patescibacteria group bacterium]
MVNILPHKTQNELKLMYYSRLFGALFLAGAFVMLVGAGVLIPAYFLAQEEADASKRYAEALSQTLSLSEGSSAGKTVTTLAEQLTLMRAYRAEPVLSRGLSAIVAGIPDDVSIRELGFKFTSTSEGDVIVTGNAETRSALIAFVDALKKEPLFKGVSVPVADLVSDTDLPFTLRFSIAAKTP